VPRRDLQFHSTSNKAEGTSTLHLKQICIDRSVA
jgi:hypothetical protein